MFFSFPLYIFVTKYFSEFLVSYMPYIPLDFILHQFFVVVLYIFQVFSQCPCVLSLTCILDLVLCFWPSCTFLCVWPSMASEMAPALCLVKYSAIRIFVPTISTLAVPHFKHFPILFVYEGLSVFWFYSPFTVCISLSLLSRMLFLYCVLSLFCAQPFLFLQNFFSFPFLFYYNYRHVSSLIQSLVFRAMLFFSCYFSEFLFLSHFICRNFFPLLLCSLIRQLSPWNCSLFLSLSLF